MSPRFCPRCHQRIDPPSMLLGGNIKVEGEIKVQCPRCRSPKAVVILRQADLPKPAV